MGKGNQGAGGTLSRYEVEATGATGDHEAGAEGP